MNANIFDLLLKITLILGAAAMLAFALKRSSAAWRHFVWSAAMTSVLVLIGVQFVMPPMVMHVSSDSPLRAFARHDGASESALATESSMKDASASDVSESQTSSALDVATDDVRSDASAHSEATTKSVAPSVQVAIEPEALQQPSADAPGSEQHSGVNNAWFIDHARNILLSVWAIGTLLFLARLVRSHRHLRTLVKSARILNNVELNEEVARVRAQLSENRAVTLLSHPNVHAPCTAGWRAPMIMLSDTVMQWSHRRRQAVLTHELAHIVRGDSVMQTIASVVCALFWFHPLVWVGARAIRGESERAADDIVIGAGMSPVEYADHLLAIANRSAFMHAVPTAAIGMAKTSQLETRLRAMLSAHQSRRTISRAAKRVVGMTTLLAVIPLAGAQVRVQPPTVVRPQPGAPRKTPPAAPAPSVNARPSKPTESVAPTTTPPVASLPIATPPVAAAPASPPRVVDREIMAPPIAAAPKSAPPMAARPMAPPMSAAPTSVAVATAPPMVEVPRVAPAPNTATAAIAAPAVELPREITSSSAPIDTVIQSEMTAAPGGTLNINLMTGGRVVVHGWDEPKARLSARITGEHWRETKVVFAKMQTSITLMSLAENENISLRAPDPDANGTISGVRIRIRGAGGSLTAPPQSAVTLENSFELWVPRTTNIRLQSAGGDVQLLEVEGTFTGTTKSGLINKSKQNPPNEFDAFESVQPKKIAPMSDWNKSEMPSADQQPALKKYNPAVDKRESNWTKGEPSFDKVEKTPLPTVLPKRQAPDYMWVEKSSPFDAPMKQPPSAATRLKQPPPIDPPKAERVRVRGQKPIGASENAKVKRRPKPLPVPPEIDRI